MQFSAGTLIKVGGGYDFEPDWLGGREHVTGRIEKWIPGQDSEPACVVRLDAPLKASGDVHGKRQECSGRFLVLGLRYVGQEWERSGTVHVGLCEAEPESRQWGERVAGACVESHATYTFQP